MTSNVAPHIHAGEVEMRLDGISLHGDLTLPPGVMGIVLFAHGSGSSRFSPRNRAVAGTLHEGRIGTLLLDLLTTHEEHLDAITRSFRFDIPMLASRLASATEWIRAQGETRMLPVGYFGASTGAAAALVAAARLPGTVKAVVSRGGRPDLAGDALRAVRAPTLLIVGGADVGVVDLNRAALDALRCEKAIEIVPGATHLFEEPGTLERVAELARDWFRGHFTLTG